MCVLPLQQLPHLSIHRLLHMRKPTFEFAKTSLFLGLCANLTSFAFEIVCGATTALVATAVDHIASIADAVTAATATRNAKSGCLSDSDRGLRLVVPVPRC